MNLIHDALSDLHVSLEDDDRLDGAAGLHVLGGLLDDCGSNIVTHVQLPHLVADGKVRDTTDQV
jgi:hypothetical protein